MTFKKTFILFTVLGSLFLSYFHVHSLEEQFKLEDSETSISCTYQNSILSSTDTAYLSIFLTISSYSQDKFIQVDLLPTLATYPTRPPPHSLI